MVKQTIKRGINLNVYVIFSCCIHIEELIELKLLIQTPRRAAFVRGDPCSIFEVEKVSNFDADDRGDPIPIIPIIACLPAKG
jgi:hypothetical protein